MRRLGVLIGLVGIATPAAAQPVPLAKLTLLATMSQPVAMAVRPGDPALYVAEKTGAVRAAGGEVPVLDLRGQVSQGFEQGLLGLAFSPSGQLMYVNYTDLAGDTHVTEYAFSGGRADPATRRDVLVVDQPFPNHNGGNLLFGPDGYLYIGLGDGGSAGDPQGNAQNLGTLLGKMLRIDPRPSGPMPYRIPSDNPFAGRPGARPEIWSYGLRNPWRYGFDRLTGDLWIADVGQDRWEEVDRQPASSRGGENYGWNRMEGNHPYQGGTPGGTPPPDHTPPVYEYAHNGISCSVTGGTVYRGTRLPWLAGAYVFGDFCDGVIQTLRVVGGIALPAATTLRVPQLASFGEDVTGELYVLSLAGPVYRIDPLL